MLEDVVKKVQCPICHYEMIEESLPQKRAFKYETCIRKCLNCRIGASNSKNNPTFIYEDFHKNIPFELLEKFRLYT